jgi:hypothetical protein
MEIKIEIEKLREKKLFVATPMYGGQCTGIYTKSTNDLAMACAKYDIDVKFYYLFNESLITRARNYCVDEFLRSDSTHLLFIDSDIGFNFKDVFTLMHFCDINNNMGIVTGPYPKKTIAWEKIKKAVDVGYGANNPFELEQFVGDFVFNPAEGITEFRIDEPVKIREGGTGFMIIDREVFTRYADAYPALRYLPDHVRTKHFDGTREITAFFDCVIDPESKRYLSEDYMFCQNATKIGIPVWMLPWVKLVHEGSYTYGGSIAAMAAIAAAPTATPQSNPKNYPTNPTTPKPPRPMLKKGRR